MPWSPSTVAGEESRRRRAALMAKPLPQRFEGFSCLFNCWKPFVGLAGTRMARIDPLNGLTGKLWGKLSDCLLSRAALKRRLRPMWISNCIGITKERKHLARHEQTLGDKLRTGFGAVLYVSLFQGKAREVMHEVITQKLTLEWRPMTLANVCMSLRNLKPRVFLMSSVSIL